MKTQNSTRMNLKSLKVLRKREKERRGRQVRGLERSWHNGHSLIAVD